METEKKKGISLGKLNIIMIVVAVILSVCLLYATWNTMSTYTETRRATEAYIECQLDTANMQAGSDYLTEKVRQFVVTGDLEYIQDFVEEVNVTRRRDKALQNLDAYLNGTETYGYLQEALKLSNDLIGREYHAMRLGAAGYGIGEEKLPAEVRSVALSAEENALSDDEKRDRAVEMVFGEEYQNQKSEIYARIERCSSELIDSTRNEQISSSSSLLKLMRQQLMLVTFLLVIVLAVILFTMFLVIHPLRVGIAHIRKQERIPLTGSSEFQYLAEAYNVAYEENRKNQDELSYEATHDSMTGLYNRSMFEKLRASGEVEHFTLILVDVDYFKQFNDTYGHDVGDKVLQKVAGVLTHHFRSDDYVLRIGGDEFVVLMRHTGVSLRELVHNKIEDAKAELVRTSDGVPAITLSVGVAFPDRENPGESIFKDADLALYHVKELGRNGMAFYGEF